MKILLLLFSLSLLGQAEPIAVNGNILSVSQADGTILRIATGRLHSTPPSEMPLECGAANGCRGYDFFKRSKGRYHFSFDTGRLELLNEDQIDFRLGHGFDQIKSRFTKRGVFITFKIRRQEFEFLFDTGYSGSFHLNSSSEIPFVKDAHQIVESIDGQSQVYNNKWITVNDIYYAATIAISKAKSSKVGMAFLKGFDWIIDFDKKRVYLKKNAIGLESSSVRQAQVKGIDQNLVIVSKIGANKNVRLGDIIIGVNGQAVTPINICEIEQRLNELDNWADVKLEIFAANNQ